MVVQTSSPGLGARGMTQDLIVLDALAVDPGSVFRTHIVVHNHLQLQFQKI